MSALLDAECSICERFINEEDEMVITDCNHVFHRKCGEERIEKNQKTDCHSCQKVLALADALFRDSLITIRKPTDQNLEQIRFDKKDYGKEDLDGLEVLPNTIYDHYRVLSNDSTVKDACIRDLPPCHLGAKCQDTTVEHETAYQHLPMCPQSRKCTKFRTHVKNHCEAFRHCIPHCSHGSYCVNFHEKKHIEEYQHPFPKPCSFTPYQCTLYEKFTTTQNLEELSDEVHQHFLDFAHVCRFGRNCTNQKQFHWEKSIHVHRHLCPDGDKCTKIVQEDHLNSFTHPKIRDIRLLCKHADKCRDRRDPYHLARFRHTLTFGDSGVVRYYNLNKNIDFVSNQQNNIEHVIRYLESQKWKPLPSGSIPDEIIDWIRTVQPVHRCKREIFESILLHGHVMSRDYMRNLKKPEWVVNSILQHNRIQQIQNLKIKTYADHAREYITALVTNKFKNKNSETIVTEVEPPSPGIFDQNSPVQLIQTKEAILRTVIPPDDMEAIESTANAIAQASIELHLNPFGIGYEKDKALGTNKTVFSILGPHLGQYGDIFIVFKREILHHPDANFSIQAATSYASGNAFKWRPWLNAALKSTPDPIELFHATKLHASIPDYEYAAALELIAVTSHNANKKTMDIDLKTILEEWQKVDSHKVIEAHLPQLIPLDYIEHIYITKTTFDLLSENAQKALRANFNNHTTIRPFESSKEHEKFVNKELIEKFGQRDTHSLSRPIRGSIITLPSTNFTYHYVLPLTISQAYVQYKIDQPEAPTNITTYIYWQVMNGDMMLTLSNEQINPNGTQSMLKCLICYLAEKPSTKDSHYHEHASYLNSGRPFQHAVFINERKYAAHSTAFYVGCNTDGLMTFCLEIQRSTGKVILSHSGPNSIYNHKTISCTFDNNDLDLNQLNYIHVSAGARTVPVRNLIVTFEKETEPLDSSNTILEHAQPDHGHQSIDNNSKTQTRSKRFVKKSGKYLRTPD